MKRLQLRIKSPSYTKVQWQQSNSLFVEGAFTGNAYRFNGYGTTHNVDDRDKNVLSIEGMKKVS
jgi:hypothetical protein